MPSFTYRRVIFKIEVIGSDLWRWSILPRRETDITLIGQFAGSKDEALTYCRSEIDKLVKEHSPEERP